MNSDEARLHAHLDRVPNDTATRQVLADLLEEQGQEAAAGFQRWLVAQGLWPDNDLAFSGHKGWHWWSRVDDSHRKRLHALVPIEIQPHMPQGEWIYPTRTEAEAVMAQALAKSAAP